MSINLNTIDNVYADSPSICKKINESNSEITAKSLRKLTHVEYLELTEKTKCSKFKSCLSRITGFRRKQGENRHKQRLEKKNNFK